MATLRKKDLSRLRQLLTDLGYGQAETESGESVARRFHPVAEHVRAFDPDVTLVVGERGAGKSALFRAVFDNGLLSALARFANARLPTADLGCIAWVQAHPLGRDFPDALGLRRSVAGQPPERALKLWFAYLLRALRGQLGDPDAAALQAIWEQPGGAPDEVLKAFDEAAEKPLLALDRLDERLEREGRWLFVGYDELDTLGGFDWDVMRQALVGLISFWASYSRRWRRLRAKLFLRTDLFRRHADFGGADLAKLAANRAELTWSDRNLYAMLVKRIVNTHEDLHAYCQPSKLPFKEDPDLGFVPDLSEAEMARSFIDRLVGQYMGAGEKKGQTFAWLLDHLRDGRGHVVPRNLVRLVEQAATKDTVNTKARAPRLLHPTALRQALEDVSADFVRQGINNEWPWLHGVHERIRGRLMPLSRREFQDLLRKSWEDDWGSSGSRRPPVDSAAALVDYLLELGVVRERTRDRIDVPDVYLFGLELKRKGGVRVRPLKAGEDESDDESDDESEDELPSPS